MLTRPDFCEKKVIIVLTKNGDKISFQNDNIIVKNGEGKTKLQYTCYKIFMILIVGPFNVTSGLVERANRFGFSIVFMSFGFKVYATINARMDGNTLLREKQYTCTNADDIAKKIIINKIVNQRETILKIRASSESRTETLELLKKYIKQLENAVNIASTELMGVEGMAAKIYFKEIFNMTNWQGRQPRVKRDEINLLLDIGYTLLFNYIEAIANIYGFDTYKGVLHKEFFKRKSLICDFIEPFRPVIDYKVRNMYSLGQVNINDFDNDNGRFSLKWEQNSKYMALFIEEIVKYNELIFNYIQSYYRWFMKGANPDKYPYTLLYK